MGNIRSRVSALPVNPLRAVAALTFTLATIWVVVKYADFSAILEALRRTDIGLLMLSVVVFWLNYFFRSVRFSYLLKEARNSRDFFYQVCFHGAAAYFVPFRLGELAFPWLVDRHHKGSRLDALRALLLARICDLAMLGLVSGISLLFFSSFFVQVLRQAGSVEWLTVSLDAWTVPVALGLTFCSALLGLGALYRVHGTVKESLVVAASTAAIWCSVGLFFFLVAGAIGAPLSLLMIVVLLLLTAFGQILPLQGIASTGAHELAWGTAYLVSGESVAGAIGLAVAAHVLVALVVATLLAPSLTSLLPASRRKV